MLWTRYYIDFTFGVVLLFTLLVSITIKLIMSQNLPSSNYLPAGNFCQQYIVDYIIDIKLRLPINLLHIIYLIQICFVLSDNLV